MTWRDWLLGPVQVTREHVGRTIVFSADGSPKGERFALTGHGVAQVGYVVLIDERRSRRRWPGVQRRRVAVVSKPDGTVLWRGEAATAQEAADKTVAALAVAQRPWGVVHAR